MKRISKLLILQIILCLLALLLILYYLIQPEVAIMPITRIYLTNTSIIGKVLGL
jgi:hypothetical protein